MAAIVAGAGAATANGVYLKKDECSYAKKDGHKLSQTPCWGEHRWQISAPSGRILYIRRSDQAQISATKWETCSGNDPAPCVQWCCSQADAEKCYQERDPHTQLDPEKALRKDLATALRAEEAAVTTLAVERERHVRVTAALEKKASQFQEELAAERARVEALATELHARRTKAEVERARQEGEAEKQRQQLLDKAEGEARSQLQARRARSVHREERLAQYRQRAAEDEEGRAELEQRLASESGAARHAESAAEASRGAALAAEVRQKEVKEEEVKRSRLQRVEQQLQGNCTDIQELKLQLQGNRTEVQELKLHLLANRMEVEELKQQPQGRCTPRSWRFSNGVCWCLSLPFAACTS